MFIITRKYFVLNVFTGPVSYLNTRHLFKATGVGFRFNSVKRSTLGKASLQQIQRLFADAKRPVISGVQII
jgi:protein tyrosine phosphatase (PTP) superfamily phosphohydrolase (DUF442 family)